MTYKWSGNELTFSASDSINVADYNSNIRSMTAPIGSIVAWLKSLTGTPTLPDGWVECNGQTLSDPESPLNGQTIPNLNGANSGTKRFLRGSTTSGTTGGAISKTVSFVNTSWNSNAIDARISYCQSGHDHTITDIRPLYYEVVWIMRVK